MKIKFYPQNVCCEQMEIEIEDDKIVSAHFYGGCNGNLSGISKLIKGMGVQEVIDRLEGTTCGENSTSCPDQLSTCLKQYLTEVKQGIKQSV